MILLRACVALSICSVSIAFPTPAAAKDGEKLAVCLVAVDELRRSKSAVSEARQEAALYSIAFLSAAYEVGGLDIPNDVAARILGLVKAKAMLFDAMTQDAKQQAVKDDIDACHPVLQPIAADFAAIEGQLQATLAQREAATAGPRQEMKKQAEWFVKQLQARGAYVGSDRSKAYSITTNLTVNSAGTTTEIVIEVQSETDTISDVELISAYCPTAKQAEEYCRLTTPITPIKIKISKNAAGDEIDGRALQCLVADRVVASRATGQAPPLSCDSFF
jgi:hypothetical protein